MLQHRVVRRRSLERGGEIGFGHRAVALRLDQYVGDLVAVVGEEALSARDKLYLTFAENFERKFISQGVYENRDIDATLDLGWGLLSALPETELKRIDPETIKKWHPKYRDKPLTPVLAS